ncbi:DUF3618 domain-containing protein [Streptomyces sp. NPDC048416]|uniref:DUF3618 domain-containing protein n=1 Tax=Streptomyces sp. NPDC048416 TaxID=3365546 RepID=UPI0037112E68
MTRPPHDDRTAAGSDELREQVERTREELGRTVEALAAKADVKGRARDKAAEVRRRAAARAAELKVRTAEVAHQVQDKVPDPVKDKAARAAGVARTAVAQAGRVGEETDLEASPDAARHTLARAGRAARDHRALLLAAGGATVVVWLAYRRTKG